MKWPRGRQSVGKELRFREDLTPETKRITLVRIRYQKTSNNILRTLVCALINVKCGDQ